MQFVCDRQDYFEVNIFRDHYAVSSHGIVSVILAEDILISSSTTNPKQKCTSAASAPNEVLVSRESGQASAELRNAPLPHQSRRKGAVLAQTYQEREDSGLWSVWRLVAN